MEIERYTIPRVLGVKQAAAAFGIAEHALRAWIRAGQLPVIQCGRKHLINCTVLSRFLSGCAPRRKCPWGMTAQDDPRLSSSAPDTLSPRGRAWSVRLKLNAIKGAAACRRYCCKGVKKKFEL